MNLFHKIAAAASLTLVVSSSGVAQAVRTYDRPVAQGVELIQSVKDQPNLVVSGLRVDPDQPGVAIRAFVADDHINKTGREVVTSAVERLGAVGGINGDFFPWTADPLGFTVIDGRLVSEPYPDRPAFGVTADGRAVMGTLKMSLTFHFPNGRFVKPNGVDRPATAGELVVYERYWGKTTAAPEDAAVVTVRMDWESLMSEGKAPGIVLGVKPNTPNVPVPEDGIVLVARGPRATELINAASGQNSVEARLIVQDEDGRSWLGVKNSVGGYPWLVKRGGIRRDDVGIANKGSFGSRHPRTAAGVARNGDIYLVVVDGRQATSRGATLEEMAQIMLNLGCVDAINLDGGGSSTIVVRDMVVNSPSDGQQRQVASGFVVNAADYSGMVTGPLVFDPPTASLVAGSNQSFSLLRQDTSPLSTSQRDRTIWGTKNGGGFAEQNGTFTGLKEGNPVVMSWLNGLQGQALVRVVPKGPNTIALSWERPGRLQIEARDAAGNAVPFADVRIAATGAAGAPAALKLGPDGKGAVDIQWDSATPAAERSVKVTLGDVSQEIRK